METFVLTLLFFFNSQRNREHAKRSRLRKKSLTVTLQQSMEELKAENKKLRTQIYSMIGQEKAESILTARKTRSDERFLSGLQDPKNRIVDDSTIAFLKSLQKQIK
jgi:cell division protein FtsB